MERVSFITVETGDDLILTFAVQCHDDASEIESLILMRTPKYESFLEEHERGVGVSFERHEDDEDAGHDAASAWPCSNASMMASDQRKRRDAVGFIGAGILPLRQ